MFDKMNMQINMNGKEYLEYKKYKDNKFRQERKNRIEMIKIIIILFFGLLALSMIYNIFAPKPQPINFTWDNILMFLTISAGIGWILHGTGFLLVRA